jgi:hypothetical protein
MILAATRRAARIINLKLPDDGIDCFFGITKNHAGVVFKEQRVIDASKA